MNYIYVFLKQSVCECLCKRPKCWEPRTNWEICAIAKYKHGWYSNGYRIIQAGSDLRRFPLQALLEAGTIIYPSWVAQGFIQFGLGNLQGCRLHNCSTSGLLSWKCFGFICNNAHFQSVEAVSFHQASGWALSEHLSYNNYLQLFFFFSGQPFYISNVHWDLWKLIILQVVNTS